MKTLIVCSLLLSPLVGQSQDGSFELKRNILKVAPQQFRVKSLKLGVEHLNSNRDRSYSLYVTLRKEKNNQGEYPTGYDGLGGEFQYRAYLKPLKEYSNHNNKKYDQGIYLAGFIQGNGFSGDQFYPDSQYDQVTNTYSTTVYHTHQRISNWATGVMIGLQHTFWKLLSVDVYAGGGVQWSDISQSGSLPPYYGFYYINPGYDYSEPGFQGILPKVGLQIGIGL